MTFHPVLDDPLRDAISGCGATGYIVCCHVCAAVLAPDTRLSVLFRSAQCPISVAKCGADVTGARSANASAHIKLDNLEEVWSDLRK